MGLRADDEPWPRPAPAELLAERRRILASHPEAVAMLPEAGAACAEVAALVGVATFEEAAVVQPDDLCVLVPGPGWPLVAGAVLFPSHWRLAEKLGRPVAEVHGRVPGMDAVAPRIERFLDRLRPGQVAWRSNVLFHRSGSLHSPWPDEGDELWYRTERQTFRRLPSTGAVLFAIATTTTPVAALDPAERARLTAWVRAAPPAWAPYAGVDLPGLLEALDQ